MRISQRLCSIKLIISVSVVGFEDLLLYLHSLVQGGPIAISSRSLTQAQQRHLPTR